jgi:hypothetical protein
MNHLATPRIGEFGEVILKSGGLGLGHGIHSWASAIPPTLAASQQAAEIAIAQSCQITQDGAIAPGGRVSGAATGSGDTR